MSTNPPQECVQCLIWEKAWDMASRVAQLYRYTALVKWLQDNDPRKVFPRDIRSDSESEIIRKILRAELAKPPAYGRPSEFTAEDWRWFFG